MSSNPNQPSSPSRVQDSAVGGKKQSALIMMFPQKRGEAALSSNETVSRENKTAEIISFASRVQGEKTNETGDIRGGYGQRLPLYHCAEELE